MRYKLFAVICLLVGLCSAFALFVFKEDKNEIPILMYHHLSENGPYNTMTITPERFKFDMDYLKRFGFTPLLPADLIDIYENRRSMPVRPVMIVFDDGYLSNYTYAYPILKETGMKASITLITNLITENNSESESFLSWKQAKEMRDSGIVDIGSHSHNLHNPDNEGNFTTGEQTNGVQRFKDETEEEYEKRVGTDLEKSLNLIEENTSKPAILFSYPFGATDKWFTELPQYTTIAVSVTTQFKIASIKDGITNLPRLRVDMNTTLGSLKEIVKISRRKVKAYPNELEIMVNDKKSTIASYKINDENYIRIRNLADLLKDTPYCFDISWSSENNSTEITTNKKYTGPVDTSMPGNSSFYTVPMDNETYFDGVNRCITSFQINKNTYYRLADLSAILGFKLENDCIITTK